MKSEPNDENEGYTDVPVIDLTRAPGERATWDRPKVIIYLWSAMEILFVTNPWQISSALRVLVLRIFGAQIGSDVVIRPRTRVKFPWKLNIGDRTWVGEGVWIHNQDEVALGADVVISQESFLTTGSHAHRQDMALLTAPILIQDGTWVTSRCMILGGTDLGKSSLVTPMSVVRGTYPSNVILSGNPASVAGTRF
jgi:putative colanic acid biosynthesis acetyltransferase WcaF